MYLLLQSFQCLDRLSCYQTLQENSTIHSQYMKDGYSYAILTNIDRTFVRFQRITSRTMYTIGLLECSFRKYGEHKLEKVYAKDYDQPGKKHHDPLAMRVARSTYMRCICPRILPCSRQRPSTLAFDPESYRLGTLLQCGLPRDSAGRGMESLCCRSPAAS